MEGKGGTARKVGSCRRVCRRKGKKVDCALKVKESVRKAWSMRTYWRKTGTRKDNRRNRRILRQVEANE